MKFRDWTLSLLSVVLLLLGIHPFKCFFCSWLAWIPLFILIEIPRSRIQRTLFLIFLVFLVYYCIENSWILYYQLPLFIVTVVGLATTVTVYFACYLFLAAKSQNISFRIIFAFALWVLFQYLIRLTPVTTAAFETSFYGPTAFFQIAALLDYSFLGALIISLSLALVLFVQKRCFQTTYWIVFLSACLLSLYAWGHHRLQLPANSNADGLKVALIQHNIPVSGKWRLDHPDEIRTRYRSLALKAAQENPELIIFPLYDFPDDLLRQPAFFESLAKKTGAYLLAASHIPQIPGKSIFEFGYQNVAVLYAPDGKILGHYQSVQKAPSFSPIKEHSAREYKVLDSPLGKLGILLCYEDTKPRFAQMAKKEGSKYLIALSNPGFFSKTNMPYYHLIQDRLRAIETGRPLLRVSSNGYSAAVDPKGRFILKSNLEQEEILIATV